MATNSEMSGPAARTLRGSSNSEHGDLLRRRRDGCESLDRATRAASLFLLREKAEYITRIPIPVKKFVDQMRAENIRMRNLRRRDKKKYRRLAIQHHQAAFYHEKPS